MGDRKKIRKLSPRTVEEMKAKIRVDRIIDRLMDHIDCTEADENGVCHGTMAPSAVTASLGLLRKILPDITESKVEIAQKSVDQMSDAELNAEIERVGTLLGIAAGQAAAPKDPSKLN